MANYKDSSLPVEERLKDLMQRMTFEEKIDQITCLVTITEEIPDFKEYVPNGIGNVGAFTVADSVEEIVKYADKLQRYLVNETRLGIPALIHCEACAGAQYTEADVFPSAIAQASKLPIILYNVPGRTGVNMNAETTLRLAKEYPNIIAIKEASGNITQMDDIIKNKPADFMVISGDDGITFPLLTLGAVGVISVIGNAFPKEFSKMVRLALNGDFHNALSIHHRFTELFSLLFVDGNPAGVKAMLNVMGLIENKLRLPLVPTRITTFEKMRAILDELKIKC